jgi:putative flippase GtrA
MVKLNPFETLMLTLIRFFISQLGNPWLLVRYIVSGLIAASVQLGVLVLLVERLGMWHIQAVMIAFVVSAMVAFVFQKFWTFRDHSMEGAHFQLTLYALLVSIAFSLNVTFMYLFVDILHLWYVLAQVLTIGLVTIVTFLSNKYFIFKRGSALL